MKKLLLLLLLCVASANAQEPFNYSRDFQNIQKRSQDKKDAYYYPDLLKRFQHNDPKLTDAEVLALMIGYTTLPTYKPDTDHFKEGVIFSLNDEANYKDAIGVANKYLANSPVSLKANFAKAQAFRKLDLKDSVAVYDKKWQRLLKAMFYSGKGMKIENPIFSMGLEDAQEFIAMYIGATIESKKSIKDKDNHILQQWNAALDKQKKLVLFFIVDHAAKKVKDYMVED